jgi:Uma2 family endonuclease
MATRSKAREIQSLEEFLHWPRIDEKPYLEYIDGKIEVKVAAQRRHSAIQGELCLTLNLFARPSRLGLALPELRCNFAGRSIIPDIVFHLDANIQTDANGVFVDEVFIPPDIHIEIRSPDQSVKKTKQKLEHSVANGCPLAWYIDPELETIDVYRPGVQPERLSPDGFLDGTPVLPGFRLAVAEVFGWLRYRTQNSAGPEATPR